MSQEYAEPRPYWVENRSEAELRSELDQLTRALDLQNPPDPPLSWRDRTRAEQDLKRVKRLLSEAESRRLHEEVQLRKPLTAEDAGCGRLRRVTHARRLVVPDAVEFARCQVEKELIAGHVSNMRRESRFMPVQPPGM